LVSSGNHHWSESETHGGGEEVYFEKEASKLEFVR
jgi:hypothetical protein